MPGLAPTTPSSGGALDNLNRRTDAGTDGTYGNSSGLGPLVDPNSQLYTPNGYRRVYLGAVPFKQGTYVGSTYVSQDRIVTDAAAMVDIWTWTDAAKKAFGAKLFNAGVIKSPDDWQGMLSEWQKAVAMSADAFSAGKKITPFQVVDMNVGLRGPTAAKARTTTNTSTAIGLPSESNIRGTVEALFKEKVGRAPTKSEISKYVNMAMSAARANPQKQTTTTTTDPNGNSRSNQTSSGGVDLSTVLGDAVQGTSEAGTYQAATYYMNALQGVLGAAV